MANIRSFPTQSHNRSLFFTIGLQSEAILVDRWQRSIAILPICCKPQSAI
ncbi:MAG: hypothetical protein HC778_03005 [Chamaesiphon sp. CSU_1_12]|nr:hypothetical protein [Chamaesiphon sp. CSU_1_12]